MFGLVVDQAYQSVAPEGFVFACFLLSKGELREKACAVSSLCSVNAVRVLKYIMGEERAATVAVKYKYPST